MPLSIVVPTSNPVPGDVVPAVVPVALVVLLPVVELVALLALVAPVVVVIAYNAVDAAVVVVGLAWPSYELAPFGIPSC